MAKKQQKKPPAKAESAPPAADDRADAPRSQFHFIRREYDENGFLKQ